MSGRFAVIRKDGKPITDDYGNIITFAACPTAVQAKAFAEYVGGPGARIATFQAWNPSKRDKLVIPQFFKVRDD